MATLETSSETHTIPVTRGQFLRLRFVELILHEREQEHLANELGVVMDELFASWLDSKGLVDPERAAYWEALTVEAEEQTAVVIAQRIAEFAEMADAIAAKADDLNKRLDRLEAQDAAAA